MKNLLKTARIISTVLLLHQQGEVMIILPHPAALLSSKPSRQSGSPSHSQSLSIQRPDVHRNSSSVQFLFAANMYHNIN